MAYESPSRVFQRNVSPQNLKEVYAKHVEASVSRGRDGVHPRALRHRIADVGRDISTKLTSGDYRFIQYKELLASKGAGKPPRVLSVPSAIDRIALRALADFLAEVYPDACGVIPQIPVRKLSEVIQSGLYDSYIRLDIVNFFPSIPHEQVEAALRKRIRKDSIIKVVLNAIRTPTVPQGFPRRSMVGQGVPQGLPISNILAELIMLPLDRKFSTLDDCAYFRYVDDIVILCCENKVDEIDALARESIRELGFVVHDRGASGNKSCAGGLGEGFSYLGYKFSMSRVSVRDANVKSLEARLAREFTRFKRARRARRVSALRICRNKVNLAISGGIYDGKAKGWLQFFRQMDDLELLKRLDNTVEKLARRAGVPKSFRPKKFVRAYYAVHHPHGKDARYVPKFDNLSAAKMREVLVDFLGDEDANDISDDDVPHEYRRTMNKAFSELEQDIGDIS